MLYQLLEKGYPSFMLHENGLYKVQTGAYQQIGNAVNMEQRLRDDGYSTVIVTKQPSGNIGSLCIAKRVAVNRVNSNISSGGHSFKN